MSVPVSYNWFLVPFDNAEPVWGSATPGVGVQGVTPAVIPNGAGTRTGVRCCIHGIKQLDCDAALVIRKGDGTGVQITFATTDFFNGNAMDVFDGELLDGFSAEAISGTKGKYLIAFSFV